MKALLLTVIALIGGAAACSAQDSLTNHWMDRILTNDESFMTDSHLYWKVMTSVPPLATNAESFFKIMTTGSLPDRRRAEVDFYVGVQGYVGPMPTVTEQDKALVTSVLKIKNQIESGNSVEKEFRLYCETVDALLRELAEEQQRGGSDYQARLTTYIGFITFDAQILTGDSIYLNHPDNWEYRKKQLEAFQKWKR
jgi:hypothetical protein